MKQANRFVNERKLREIFKHNDIRVLEIRIIGYRLQSRHAHREVRQFCQLQAEVSKLDAGSDIVLCMSQLNLLAQAYHRILKFSHIIVNTKGSEEIQFARLAKARQYHPNLIMVQ